MTDPEINSSNSGAAAIIDSRLVLSSTLTINESSALKQQMLKLMTTPAPYEIDATAVERIDASAVQILVAFSLDCLEQGASFKWSGRSEVLDQTLELLGVSSLVESP